MTNKKLKIIAIASLSLLAATTALSVVLAVFLFKPKPLGWHEQSVELIDLKYDVKDPGNSTFWEINISAKIKDYNDSKINSGILEIEFEYTTDKYGTLIEKSKYIRSVAFTNNGFNLEKLYTNQDFYFPTIGGFGLQIPLKNVSIKNVYFCILAYN